MDEDVHFKFCRQLDSGKYYSVDKIKIISKGVLE